MWQICMEVWMVTPVLEKTFSISLKYRHLKCIPFLIQTHMVWVDSSQWELSFSKHVPLIVCEYKIHRVIRISRIDIEKSSSTGEGCHLGGHEKTVARWWPTSSWLLERFRDERVHTSAREEGTHRRALPLKSKCADFFEVTSSRILSTSLEEVTSEATGAFDSTGLDIFLRASSYDWWMMSNWITDK